MCFIMMLQNILILDYKVREFTCQTEREASRPIWLHTGTIVNKNLQVKQFYKYLFSTFILLQILTFKTSTPLTNYY
jgi:hypothetical protein